MIKFEMKKYLPYGLEKLGLQLDVVLVGLFEVDVPDRISFY
jgi:hypothetical protein